MMAVSGKKLSEIAEDIRKEYGEIHMEERAYRFTAEEKERIHKTLMMDQALPEIPFEIDHVSYMDGCKVYLKMEAGSAPGSRNGTAASHLL